MRDAIGGVFSLQIILIFVILINGYMAYSVNYTRAFRVKNGIINIVEEREGFSQNSKTTELIHNYVTSAGYGLSSVQQQKVRNNNTKMVGIVVAKMVIVLSALIIQGTIELPLMMLLIAGFTIL